MRHRFFVGSSSINTILFEVFGLKKHSFRFMGDRFKEKSEGFIDVKDNGFKCFSGFNWSVGSIMYWGVVGYINKYGCWFLIQWVQESGSEIQGRIVFSWSFLAHVRRRYKGGVGRRCGLLLGGYIGLRKIRRGR